jgi:hypothetical protein
MLDVANYTEDEYLSKKPFLRSICAALIVLQILKGSFFSTNVEILFNSTSVE